MISYTISDPDSAFRLKRRTEEEIGNLFVSFFDFSTYSDTVKLKDGNLDMSTIIMKMEENLLDEVIITAKSPPVTIKEERNKGYFSRATAGGRTNEGYEMKAYSTILKINSGRVYSLVLITSIVQALIMMNLL